MKTVIITILFSFIAIYLARTLNALQFMPARLQAFISLTFFSILVISQPQLSLYLVIGSVTFYDPRYWWSAVRLYLHQEIILLSLVLFIGMDIHQKKKFLFHPLDLLLGIFLFTFIISSAVSADLALSVKWITYFLIFLSGYFLLRLAVSNEEQLRKVIWFLIFCGMASGIISFFRSSEGSRVGSLVLVNPNSFGNYLALILPLPLAFLFHGHLSRSKRTMLFVAVVPLIVSLIFTLSRSSWAGCGVGLFALGFLRPKFKYFLLLAVGLGIILLIPAVQERLIEDKADSGIIYRQSKTRIAFEMFKEQPILGYGPGGFQALAPNQEEWAAYAHSALESMYMRILAEGGLLQALVFLCLVIYFNRLGWQTIKALPPGFLQTAVLGSVAAFWAGLGIGIGEDILLSPMTNWLLGFYLAVIIKSRELVGMDAHQGQSIPPEMS